MKINTKRGFISTVILIIALLILIAYFRNDLMAIVGSDKFKDAVLTAINWIRTALTWIIEQLGWTSEQIKQ